MSVINDQKAVQKQYENAANLNTRISIHEKYSVNRQGFGNWIASHYFIPEGSRILELGCGTGELWKQNIGLIERCSELVLTDFSKGVLQTARKNIGNLPNVAYRVVDIQKIPYASASFDLVIANMMLYHVPDIKKGLSEVKRVLKKEGSFTCATYGEHGIVQFIAGLLKPYGAEERVNKKFYAAKRKADSGGIFFIRRNVGIYRFPGSYRDRGYAGLSVLPHQYDGPRQHPQGCCEKGFAAKYGGWDFEGSEGIRNVCVQIDLNKAAQENVPRGTFPIHTRDFP